MSFFVLRISPFATDDEIRKTNIIRIFLCSKSPKDLNVKYISYPVIIYDLIFLMAVSKWRRARRSQFTSDNLNC